MSLRMMDSMPQLVNVLATVGIFIGVFIIANLLARATGYRE